MKKPLQSLLISGKESRDLVFNKTKKISIRADHRSYEPGHVTLCDFELNWCVLANVTKVQHKTLREVTKEECEADGFPSKIHMRTGLRKFYPTMNWDSPITVIEWEYIE